MTGPVEEGGKAANAIIESLKSSPITLALVIFNLMFVTLIYVNARDLRDSFDKTTKTLLEHQADMAKMLFNCAPVQSPPTP